MSEKKKVTPAYSIPAEEVCEQLNTNKESGLTSQEANKRIKEFGKNILEKGKEKSAFEIFLNQFKSPVVLLLFIAMGLSLIFGDWLDAIAILLVILINSVVGFIMEYQAHLTMNALKKISSVSAKVVRNSKLEEIDAEGLVPGDIVYVEAGDIISADGRVITCSQLQIDESTLTGESLPIEKQVEIVDSNTILADRTNMLFKGTHTTKGNGYMVVTDTGMKTELGNIASMVQSAEQSATPLEKKLEEFSKKLIWITIGLAALIIIVGLINGQGLFEIIQTSIALAVAAIPEGLPIVATMALARGMIYMARNQVIVKKLAAVETLGGTNVICTDKTGTLTYNKIEVKEIITPLDEEKSEEHNEIINRIMVLCNSAEIQKKHGRIKEIGDPLETGLLKYALDNEVNIVQMRKQHPKLKEEPFTSETKVMATLHKTEKGYTVFAKGASEELLKLCDHIATNKGIKTLSPKLKQEWTQKAEELSNSGYKVISGAYKDESNKTDSLTTDLVFSGLFVLLDPPRKDAFKAIEECKTAGIKVIMITGDHPATAKNIASQLGIEPNKSTGVILGKDMSDYKKLSASEKNNWAEAVVFARVSPKQKLDLVSVLQEKKFIVGMTGDGVNDAPALKKADIGIAMGKRGTQVSQEAADIILKDDAFSSIVIAIKEGRIIFDNIRNFVVFLISCNLSELLIIACASLLNLNFQLFPLQILFINLITDVLPALALGITKGSPDIMEQPPRKMNEPIINKANWRAIFFYSVVISAVSIAAVYFNHFYLQEGHTWNSETNNNILFYSLIFSQLLHTFNMSANNIGFFQSNVIRNKWIWLAILTSLVILLIMYLLEPTSKVLHLTNLTLNEWLLAISASLISLVLIQIGKRIKLVNH